MTIWLLFEIMIFLVLGCGILLLWIHVRRAPQDDPRLSKGLQLLQSKIAILEDLADRTELQVKQLTAILEQKTIEIQNKINQAENQIKKIECTMEKSIEVANIFQDKIPHKEIIERQNTIRYVHAAQMAHAGIEPEKIAEQLKLPPSEIELITKVNQDRLMFAAEKLPEWISEPNLEVKNSDDDEKESCSNKNSINFSIPQLKIEETKDVNKIDMPLDILNESDQPISSEESIDHKSELENLRQEFTKVCREFDAKNSVTQLGTSRNSANQNQSGTKFNIKNEQTNVVINNKDKTASIKKVEFPRIDLNKNLQ